MLSSYGNPFEAKQLRPLNLGLLDVLVVDDNPQIRELLVTILDALHVKHIREAADGDAGFKEVCAAPPDIVLTDWVMEPVDGVELVRRIRQSDKSPNPFLPVVMITSSCSSTEVIEARDAGISEFLVKPITPKALYERIVSLVERPRPFIRTKTFFGPCRRQDRQAGYGGPERRRDGAGR